MAIVRVTRKQIEAARKAREAALQKDKEFRFHEEERRRILRELDAPPDKERRT